MKRRRRRRAGAVVAIATMLSAGAGVAQAYTDVSVPCGEREVTKAFRNYDDNNDYFVMQGGLFERTTGWYSTSFRILPPTPSKGAAIKVFRTREIESSRLVRSGAPPIDVRNYTQGRALALPAFSPFHITSTSVCLRPEEPSVRFFYRDPGVPGSFLQVNVMQLERRAGLSERILFTNERVQINSVGTKPTWRLSPIVHTKASNAPTADLVVTFQAAGEGWQIDNLAVDPFRPR